MTPRNPARESIGHELVGIARLLGKEPMPWQRDVFDVAFEVDAFGLLWYREIVIVVPRQSGKSTLIIPWGVHRSIMWPERQFTLYTAQSRQAARKKWLEDQWYAIEQSPFLKFVKPTRSKKREPNLSHGEEHIAFTNGSQWAIDAPTETAGHGPTLDLGMIDEAFSQADARVEAAMSPAMITRPDSQKLIVSTVGKSKAKSPFLWTKVEAGRNRVDAGLESRTLYIEFSAPEDADHLDPLVWWATMPALGYTQTEEKVGAELDSLGEIEFRRAYLNQWGDELAGEWKIPAAQWFAVEDGKSKLKPKSRSLVWVVDVAPDRSWSAISVAGQRADGLVHIETVEHHPGTGWVIDGDPTANVAGQDGGLVGLKALMRKHGGTLWYDHLTVGALVPDMRKAGLKPEAIPAQDIKVSAAALLDAVANRTVRHLGQSELTDALASASTRVFGDGWAWSRGRSMADITPLVSANLAFWMLAKTLPDLNYNPLTGIG